ncbi:MAG: type II toxin-antitoxin system RelE/ParE family toxin [Mycobacteriales bacterium]|nr:type II toxin-antitoxin system RelE/ParE family toxin [Frankia sp.]
MPRVQLTREATRHFEALPQALQDPVLNALTELEIDPEGAGKPLLGRLSGLRSARVGNFRIIYSFEGSRRSPKVIVRATKHRSVAYPRRSR